MMNGWGCRWKLVSPCPWGILQFGLYFDLFGLNIPLLTISPFFYFSTFIAELVRTAIIEDVKVKTSDFIGKDEYKVSWPGIGEMNMMKCLNICTGSLSHKLIEFYFWLRSEIYPRSWILASRMRLPTFAGRMSTSSAICLSLWTK